MQIHRGLFNGPTLQNDYAKIKTYNVAWPDFGHTMDPGGLVDVNAHLIKLCSGPSKGLPPLERVF
jgi:hypothetical protein